MLTVFGSNMFSPGLILLVSGVRIGSTVQPFWQKTKPSAQEPALEGPAHLFMQGLSSEYSTEQQTRFMFCRLLDRCRCPSLRRTPDFKLLASAFHAENKVWNVATSAFSLRSLEGPRVSSSSTVWVMPYSFLRKPPVSLCSYLVSPIRAKPSF